MLKWHNESMETKEEFIANYKNSVNNGEIIIDKNCKCSVEKIAETLYQIKKDIVEAFRS